MIVPGDSNKSAWCAACSPFDRPQMPYGGPPLAEEEIKAIRGLD